MELAAKGVILIVDTRPKQFRYNHRADAMSNGVGAYHIDKEQP
jgi:hypothetical protein